MKRTNGCLLAVVLLVGCGTENKDGDADALDTASEDAVDVESETAVDADPDLPSDVPGDPDAEDAPEDPGDDPDLDVEVEVDGETVDWIVPPATGCVVTGDPCSPGAIVDEVHAGYRKDHYLPDADYDEYTDYPLDGGRFHIAAVSSVTGTVTGLRIDGQDADDMLLTAPLLEWWHVWPHEVTAGEPVWIAFHSRNPAWDAPSATGTVVVETTAGDAVDATFPARTTTVPLTYVTTTEDLGTWIIHIENQDSVSHEVNRILLNGRDVLASGVACVPDTVIEPGRSVMWTVPSCTAIEPGSPWTVVVDFVSASPSVGVGRVVKPFFPIETWNNSSECPYPGDNEENFQALQDAAIDTVFWRFFGASSECTTDPADIRENVAPVTDDFWLLSTDDFLDHPDPHLAIGNTDGLAGFFTGDESDGEIYEDGFPKPAMKAAKASQLWDLYPEIPVYNGAKTNGHVGTFAGMVDIQGIDFYVAACAPHITVFTQQPPLRGAYDYLLNTRLNHMPLPTWMYAQGLSPAWNQTGLLGDTIHVQPDPQEILVQAMSVAAAGGKGLMWFQTNQEEAGYATIGPERWQAISDSSWMMRGVRTWLREGDPTGDAYGEDTITEMIRAREALVVPVINLLVADPITAVECAGSLVLESLVPHWVLAAHAPDIQVAVPDDFGVVDVFEVTPDGPVDLLYSYSVAGRLVTFQSVPLDNDVPVRLIVLASSEDARAQVAAATLH